MSAQELDGKALARAIQSEIAAEVAAFSQTRGRSFPSWRPCWSATIRPARSTCATSSGLASKSGIASVLHRLAADASEERTAGFDRAV